MQDQVPSSEASDTSVELSPTLVELSSCSTSAIVEIVLSVVQGERRQQMSSAVCVCTSEGDDGGDELVGGSQPQLSTATSRLPLIAPCAALYAARRVSSIAA